MKVTLPSSAWWLAFFACAIAYSIWSFTLTDPNLVFTSWAPFWFFQGQAWWLGQQIGWNAIIYVVILVVWWYSTYRLWRDSTQLSGENSASWWPWLIVMTSVAVLLFANNALSHDLFNYLFNAKMVVVYDGNPHVQVALDFPNDTWTRFMHNTHTPAPYGYGWTAWSLIPFVIGQGKFTFTWLLFKIWMAMSWLGALWWTRRVVQTQASPLLAGNSTWWFGLINPLIMIEILGNGHNDLWMMWPALVAITLALSSKTWRQMGTSAALLTLSMMVKFATLVLWPVWVLVTFGQWSSFLPRPLARFWQWVQPYWADLCVLLLFLPLLTSRSQQFHPWYFAWCLVWWPWVRSKWVKVGLIGFAISSSLRAWPWLLAGEQYFTNTLWWQQVTTWVPALLILGGGWVFYQYRPRANV